MTLYDAYVKILDTCDEIREEYENGCDVSRDDYNFDDGYVSALDWVAELIREADDFTKEV